MCPCLRGTLPTTVLHKHDGSWPICSDACIVRRMLSPKQSPGGWPVWPRLGDLSLVSTRRAWLWCSDNTMPHAVYTSSPGVLQ